MKMARAWLGLRNGTGELLGTTSAPQIGARADRESGKRPIRESRSTGCEPGGRNVP